MKAIWNDRVIAEASREDMIYIEGNWYFPPGSVDKDFLRESDTPYTCPWKGVCTYFDVGEGDAWSKDAASTYREPKPSSLEIVKKDYSNYVAFWHEVSVRD
jgi:uncharacterized protein (DUF427 family)